MLWGALQHCATNDARTKSRHLALKIAASRRWFAEAERVHSRWAMLAVAGILAQVCN